MYLWGGEGGFAYRKLVDVIYKSGSVNVEDTSTHKNACFMVCLNFH